MPEHLWYSPWNLLSCLLKHTAWHLLGHIYNLLLQDYSWLIRCLFQCGTRSGVGLSWPQPAANTAEWCNIYSASHIFQLTLLSVTTQFIPLQVHKPPFNVFLVWPAWQNLHISPAFLCVHAESCPVILSTITWGCTCCSTFWTGTPAPSPVLEAPCTSSFGWKNIPGCADWHREVFLGAQKRHFVKCSLLLFWAEMKVSGLWIASSSAGGSLAQFHSAVGCWISPSVCFLVTAILGQMPFRHWSNSSDNLLSCSRPWTSVKLTSEKPSHLQLNAGRI